MNNQNKNEQLPPPSPYEAYQLMVVDYKDTLQDVIAPIDSAAFGEDESKTAYLQQLRSNLGYFGLTQAGVNAEQIARDTGMPLVDLTRELEADERLIALTREAEERFKKPSTPESEHMYTTIDTRLVKWLSPERNGTQLQTETIHSNGMTYAFVNLTPLHRVTDKAVDRLRREGKLDRLLTTIKTHSIPHLEQAIREGKNAEFRPVQRIGKPDGDRRVETEYPAYKFGLNGTQNRAILLLMGEHDGMQLYGLASVCDHEDQDAVLNALSQNHVD